MKRISSKTVITLNINGRNIETAVYPFQTLLDVLRGNTGHTGCKPGCENGDCGACTVIWDGLPMKACLVLAVEAEGHMIRTVEGLDNTPIQEAFAKNFAMQCGYCTAPQGLSWYVSPCWRTTVTLMIIPWRPGCSPIFAVAPVMRK